MMTRRAVLVGPALFAAIVPRAWAQATPSSADIVRKLSPAPLTRSVRGVVVGPSQPVEKPTIDLYVLFDFDSSRLQVDGTLVLDRLGAALNDPQLASSRFEVAGHTDAVGAADYNQRLSELRANAAVEYLMRKFGIAPSRLAAVGYGSTRLRDPAQPAGGANRRVQITNLGETAGAKP